MELEQLQPGDTVNGAGDIFNEGGIPKLPQVALLARPGTRGVIIATGHLEDAPARKVHPVRFEDVELNLGPPAGYWPED